MSESTQIIKHKTSRVIYGTLEEAIQSLVDKQIAEGEIISARYQTTDGVQVYAVIGTGDNKYAVLRDTSSGSLSDELSWEEYD